MNGLWVVGILLVGVYGWVAFRFMSGFHRTNFSQNRLPLALLWPVLLLANPSYRQNFRKALKKG